MMEHKLVVRQRRSLTTRPAAAIKGLLPFVIVVCFALLALYRLNPPATVPANAPSTAFSSDRAMQHLQVIAQAPHPQGSAESVKVREYIVQQLTNLGLQPEVQMATGVRSPLANFRSGIAAGSSTVYNIVARIKGTATTKAILLATHYDSVPEGPGASDDGAAVVALLESARALLAAPPLRNDVILLFTDGEESGLLGSAAFVGQRALVGEVGLVLNFEARGTSGPVLMFEMSDQNGWLITQFAQAAQHPIATSLMFEIYRLLPNNTDFTVFKTAGLAGFNFAFIGDLQNYHSPNDTLSALDQRSLQHHGDYALALTRHFGALDLRAVRASNVVYFDIMGLAFAYYPVGWVVPLAMLTALLLIVVIVVGVRRRQLTPGGIALGAAAFLVMALVVVAAVTATWQAVGAVYGRNLALATNSLLMAIFAVLAIVVAGALYTALGRRRSIADLSVGALVWWLLLAILTGLYLPGGSYLFALPLLFSLIGLGAIVAGAGPLASARGATILVLCALPGIALFVPTIYLIFLALTLRMAWALAILLALALGLLVPHLCLISRAGGTAERLKG